MHEAPLTLSVPEAGSLLGIGRTLSFRLAQEGTLPTIRLGRKLRVPKAALDAMLRGDEGEVNLR